MEENTQTGMDTKHVPGDDSTHEPGDEQGKGGTSKTLDQPLAEEDVNTQEQRNQSWTQEGSDDSRRGEGEPMRSENTGSTPTLDMPDELEDKLEDVKANPSNETEPTHDTGGQLGGMPKTGSGEQDPMSQQGGGQSGG